MIRHDRIRLLVLRSLAEREIKQGKKVAKKKLMSSCPKCGCNTRNDTYNVGIVGPHYNSTLRAIEWNCKVCSAEWTTEPLDVETKPKRRWWWVFWKPKPNPKLARAIVRT